MPLKFCKKKKKKKKPPHLLTENTVFLDETYEPIPSSAPQQSSNASSEALEVLTEEEMIPNN